MRNIFLTYASEAFAQNALALSESAKAVGFDQSIIMGPEDLEGTQFYKDNEAVLTQRRGGGYWLWKPYIISRVLEQCSPNDILFYADAGRTNYYRFTRLPSRLIQQARSKKEGFLLGAQIPQFGPISQWVKRDCLVIMGADDDGILSSPPIQTSPSVWTPSVFAKDFLATWLRYCRDPRCLTDMPNTCGLPNHPGFQDHRHDQAVLSILAHKTRAPHLNFSGTLVHRLIKLRPRSGVGGNFYKRPQNLDDLLSGDNPLLILREFFRLRRAR